MLTSLIGILALFGVTARKHEFYNVAVERGENPEELYYLCELEDSDYVVYETEYVGSLKTSMAEGLSLFDIRDDEVEGYVAKGGGPAVRYSISKYPHADASIPAGTIVEHEGAKYAVLKVKKLHRPAGYDRDAYGA